METLRFRTSRTTIDVPIEKARQLEDWLRRGAAGGGAADAIANASPAGVVFTDEQKRVVVAELQARGMIEGGVDDLGPELLDLRTELMGDLKIPPYDTDT